MAQTRAITADGRDQTPAADPPAAEEVRAEATGNVVPETRDGITEGHGPQRTQAEDSDYVHMEGSMFREYIRQVEEAVRAGRPTPDLPAYEGSFERFH